MKRTHFHAFVAFCAIVGGSVSTVTAQPADVAAVEGYVFDRGTLKPLANARVEVTVILIENADRLFMSVVTDANGYYATHAPAIPTSVRTEFVASCITGRGTVTSEGTGYAPMRAEVYQRNFYLALPRRETRCRLL